MAYIRNPVLTGFNPDPSILRVGEDYYIATSTFEWFPGIAIYHSKDLANWKQVSFALTDERDLNLQGIDSACGLWAPNLTWSDGRFYIACTVVYTNRSRYKDTYNFVISAADECGPWSKPVWLNRSGFDPSIFHDEDGRKYLVNMTMDHRPDKVRFSGIDVQEYDPIHQRLLGEPVRVCRGTKFGTTEGPNIFRKGEWYYLVMAEGGTEFHHCATVARSRSVWGPYEESPYNPLITSDGQRECSLARAGHAQIIQTHDGNWVMAHLCSRLVEGYSVLGRETAIQNIRWTPDGWPCLAANSLAKPEDGFDVTWNAVQQVSHSQRVDFAEDELPLDYMTLRQSQRTCGVSIRDGRLVIRGGCSVMSKYNQGFIARRQQNLCCDFSTQMFFAPHHLNHMAGMLVYYNYDNHYFLKMTRDEAGNNLAVCSVINREIEESEPIYIEDAVETVWLKAKIRREVLEFFYSKDGRCWKQVGTQLDMRCISDEHVNGNGFTGSMLGLHCSDCQGDGIEASFSFVDYEEV